MRQRTRARSVTARQSASCGTISVEIPFNGDDVNVTGCSASPTGSIDLGDSVELSMTVSNQNDVAASGEIYWNANGSTVASDAVDIPANGSETFTTTWTPGSTGSMDIAAGSRDWSQI